jgi:hypothetical protein
MNFSKLYEERILPLYLNLKRFPERSELIANPRNNPVRLNGTPTGKDIFKNVGFFASLATGLLIILIAALINYEVMFRVKARNATTDGKNDNYYEQYYAIEENATGRAVHIPLLVIMGLILFFGWLYYYKSDWSIWKMVGVTT